MISLFARFAAVILLLGIVPIVLLLVTIAAKPYSRPSTAPVGDAYQDTIAYSAYSVRVDTEGLNLSNL